MKTLFIVLMVANVAAGAWLLLQAPVGVVREPGRMDLQLEQGRVRLMSETELTKLRQKAESDAAASVARAVAAATAATPAPAAPVAPAAPGTELPLASCIDIGPFGSDTATRKMRTRLATAGLGDHLAASTVDKITHLRITGADAAGEAQVHLILKDFPKQEMTHCSEAPAAR